MNDAEIEQYYAIRKAEGLKIDPATAEVCWSFEYSLDPYRIHPDLPEEFRCAGRERFARNPGSEIWVHFGDLPVATMEALWSHPNAKPSFSITPNGKVIWNDFEDLQALLDEARLLVIYERGSTRLVIS
jgi:hypothetical protein